MGIFNSLKSNLTTKNYGTKNTRGRLFFGASAIPPGRMKETSKIKGKNCNIPSEPGIYRHVNKETGKIDYVGQTNNLRKRQQEQFRSGKLNLETHKVAYSVSKPNTTKDDLCKTEKAHIKRHNPSGNIYSGGNGRR